MKHSNSISLFVMAAMITACGAKRQDHRTSPAEDTASEEETYRIPTAASDLPQIELRSLGSEGLRPESPGFALAECDSEDACPEKETRNSFMDLLKEGAALIEEEFSNEETVFASAVSVTRHDSNGDQSCQYVEVQKPKGWFGLKRERVARLTPEGQPEDCAVQVDRGLTTALMGTVIKRRDDFVGGVGVGGLWVQQSELVGCAAGIGGYRIGDELAGSSIGFCVEVQKEDYSE